MTSAVVTASQQADTAGDSQGARLWPSYTGLRTEPLHGAIEAALCWRAARQGFWLMIASSAVMITLIVGLWLLFR